jgi:hypothetical protein
VIRRWWQRWWHPPRRATVVVVEVALALMAVGVAAQSVAGWVVVGIAVAGGVALLVRRRGRGIVDVIRDQLRDPSAERADQPKPDLGVAAWLLPGLHVAEVSTRGGDPLGVVGDGHGFAIVLNATVESGRTWAFSEAVRILTDDPARPVAVQLLVEQRRSIATGLDPDFAPSRTYRRQLPVGGIPLWNRVLLVIRHEPAWAPETVDVRGGGAAGARNALAAVTARAVAAAARSGVQLQPTGPGEIADLLREIGDPGPHGVENDEMWISRSGSCHGVASVAVDDEQALGRVLRYAAWLDVHRSVLSVTANAIDHSLSAVVRVVAPDAGSVEQAIANLVHDGHASPLPGAQEAGFVATLPLGGGARSLADLVNQVRS